MVGDTIRIWAPVAGGEKIDYGDVGGGCGEEEVDNVVAEETATADYEDVAEGIFWLGGYGSHF